MKFLLIIFIMVTIGSSAQKLSQPPKRNYDSSLTRFIETHLNSFMGSLKEDPNRKMDIFRPCINTKDKMDEASARSNFVKDFLSFLYNHILDDKELLRYDKNRQVLFQDIQKKTETDPQITALVNALCNSFEIPAQKPNPLPNYDSVLNIFIARNLNSFMARLKEDSDYRKDIFRSCINIKEKVDEGTAWNKFVNALTAFLCNKLSNAEEFSRYKKSRDDICQDMRQKILTNKKLESLVESMCKSFEIPAPPPPVPPEPTPHNGKDPGDKKQRIDSINKEKHRIDSINREKHRTDSIKFEKYRTDTILVTSKGNNFPNQNQAVPIILFSLAFFALLFSIVVFLWQKSLELKWKAHHASGYSLPSQLPAYSDSRSLGKLAEQFQWSAKDLSEELRKSLFWSLRLMQQTEGGIGFKYKIPGYKYTAYGFFINGSEDYYGIIVYYSSGLASKIKLTISQLFRRYKRGIDVDGNYFPIVYRPITVTLHDFSCNPVNGTGTCWVSKKNEETPTGILTAKHVTPVLGADIGLSCGNSGKVSAIAPEGIDAAVIESPCVHEHAAGARLSSPEIFIAPYMPAEFWGAISSKVATRVKHVTDTCGIFDSEYLPVTIFLTEGGLNGDSGAMVSAAKPLGIYRGKYYSQGIGSGAIAQHLFQVTEIMDLKIYL